jgi:hypothetical protein
MAWEEPFRLSARLSLPEGSVRYYGITFLPVRQIAREAQRGKTLQERQWKQLAFVQTY